MAIPSPAPPFYQAETKILSRPTDTNAVSCCDWVPIRGPKSPLNNAYRSPIPYIFLGLGCLSVTMCGFLPRVYLTTLHLATSPIGLRSPASPCGVPESISAVRSCPLFESQQFGELYGIAKQVFGSELEESNFSRRHSVKAASRREIPIRHLHKRQGRGSTSVGR